MNAAYERSNDVVKRKLKWKDNGLKRKDLRIYAERRLASAVNCWHHGKITAINQIICIVGVL